ncbi:MAG TPA: TetR/AcrR family transcriptional regulator [Ktedonobacterales bacterium]|nr:TetR/AcrR family transcriptional regulator [Ktedonobacterales bacterium]
MASSVASQSLKERQRQEREQLILQAAEELLIENGYHETSIDQIAARVGVSKGTIYLHFESKEELIFALFERNQRLFQQAMETHLAAGNDPRATLESLLTYLYSGLNGKHFQMMRAILLQSPELRSRFAERRGAHHEGWSELTERVAQVLDAGKRCGEFDPAMPTPIMVAMYTNLLHPMSYTRLLEDGQIEPAEIVKQMCHFFFKGIAAEPTTQPTTAQAPHGSAQ